MHVEDARMNDRVEWLVDLMVACVWSVKLTVD
jgi:hypothetical protein